MAEGGRGEVVVAVPGTCGELFQGTVGGRRCLVSCPIDRWSVAVLRLHARPVWNTPEGREKTRQALLLAARRRGYPGGGSLWLDTELPSGKGYGSSTADVAAAVYALGLGLGRPFLPREVARLATRVEPSDSTLFPGLALFDHRQGRTWLLLGPAPPMAVLVIEPPGTVDTVAFNRLGHGPVLRRLAPWHERIFQELYTGLHRGDLEQVGWAATQSAWAHQRLLPRPELEMACALAGALGALGVCVAHSGTLLGLLFERASMDPEVSAFVARRFPACRVRWQRLVGGGPRILGRRVADGPREAERGRG